MPNRSGTLTSSQGYLTIDTSPNDSLAITANSGTYSVEYPIGTAIASGASASAAYSVGAGQARIISNGSLSYALTDSNDGTPLSATEVATVRASVSRAGNSPAVSRLWADTGFDVPATETSGGTWRDTSDCGNNISASSTTVAPHANAGYISSEAGTGKQALLAAKKFAFDLATDSFLFSVTVNMALPGANASIAGNVLSLGTGWGFYLSARTTGVLVPVFSAAGGNWSNATSYPAAVLGTALDGTDHTVTIAYDAPSRSVYYWLDGVLRAAWPNVVTPGAASLSTYPLGIGGSSGSATTASVAAKFKNVKGRLWAGAGLPLNIGAMVRSLTAYPGDLRYLAEVYPPAALQSAIAWVGQSNENGSSDWPDANSGLGAPTRDQVLSTGQTYAAAATVGSMHPQIAALGGKRGVWRTTFNTAIGSTSIVHSWAGTFVAWAAATAFGKGAYAIAAGNVYKFTSSTNVGSPNVGVSGGSAPTWPGSGTVVDNEITWTYVRAATGADVVGAVLTSSNPLFDPNGSLAAIKTQLDALPAIFAGRKFVAISIGQGDKSVGTNQASFTAGIQSVTNYLLSQASAKVLIGFTCSGLTAGLDTWLSGTGKPGYQAALASYAGNPSVFAGVDLYTSLGVLTVTADDVGLKSDNLHLNRHAITIAAALWDVALAAAGA